MTTAETSIKERSLRAVKWNYLGIMIRVGAQLIAQISLARILGPEVFGIFAVAVLITGLASVVVEMGLGSALIQHRDLCDKDIRFAFSLVTVASVIASTAAWSSSNMLGRFFGSGQLPPIICGMIPALIVQALSVVPLSLLKRNLDFKSIQIIQLIAYTTGYILIGITSALLGAGIWSLVASATTTNLIVFLGSYAKTRPSLLPLPPRDSGPLLRFGAKVTLTNVANWLVENIDNLFVGKLFGAGALGLYSVSYNLVRTPTNHLVVAIQSVLFPASSKTQDDFGLLRRGYLIIASALALIAFPVFAGVAAVSETVISALFGSKWANASGVLLPLALAMACHTIMCVAGPILWGIGRPGVELKIQLSIAVLMVAGLLFAGQFSLGTLAWGVLAIYALRAVWITVNLCKCIHTSPLTVLKTIRGGALLAIAVVAILTGEDYLLRAAGESAASRLIAEIFVACITWVGLVLAAPTTLLSRELTWQVQHLIDGTPLPHCSPFLRRLQTAYRNAPI